MLWFGLMHSMQTKIDHPTHRNVSPLIGTLNTN